MTTLSFDLWKEESTLGTAPRENTTEALIACYLAQSSTVRTAKAHRPVCGNPQCSVPNTGVSFSPRENPTNVSFPHYSESLGTDAVLR